MRTVSTVFGPPGTGKTTTLLQRVQEQLADGMDPARVGFVSFTRKAAHEARDRALEMFPSLRRDDLPYWSTLHSIAFRHLGLTRDCMLTGKKYDRFGDITGLEFEDGIDDSGRPAAAPGTQGDRYLKIHALAKARDVPLRQQWEESDLDLPWWAVERFSKALTDYKRKQGLYGFEDLLDLDDTVMDIDLLFVDEAQDLTRQQINYLRRITPPDIPVIFAGDDDQAIFGWAGADTSFLLRLRSERTVLPKSWRLPRSIKNLADDVIARCAERVIKSWQSRDEDGVVDWVGSVEELDLVNGQSWLLLARHRRQLQALENECRRQGVVYRRQTHGWSNEEAEIRAVLAYETLRKGKPVSATDARKVIQMIPGMPEDIRLEGDVSWNDLRWPGGVSRDKDWMQALSGISSTSAEYIRELKRNEEPLVGPGRVKVSTVHGAKGGQATNVFLMTDVSKSVQDSSIRNPDAETRVMYVGMTRAQNRLILCRPQTARHWRI